MKDSEISDPGILYPVMELKRMYSNFSKSENIHHNNHSATCADLPVKIVPGLNKKKPENKRVRVFLNCRNWVEHVIRNLL